MLTLKFASVGKKINILRFVFNGRDYNNSKEPLAEFGLGTWIEEHE